MNYNLQHNQQGPSIAPFPNTKRSIFPNVATKMSKQDTEMLHNSFEPLVLTIIHC